MIGKESTASSPLLQFESSTQCPRISLDPSPELWFRFPPQIQRATEQSLEMWDDGRAAMAMSGSEPPPESASQPGPLDRIDETSGSMTFPEVLALYLGRYAQKQMRQGIIPTDRMFQDEARRIMFDSADPWDQTIADNNDWLSCFRSRHLRDTPGGQEGST
ncbi:hypothetical protein DL766_003479 [Monosporascus sp. MC13-8B]|uniref:HTH CENPB-type domain-containing protein n=1 Tax=Monosporascus cannonballus TaxID=155416 RepID=A0ABY0HET7_9PEZI|nr:hypothetical protein DL763_008401 [Monosporascus cannonballus]RYO91522.1 hypothetical protein DL762_002136 [Monosporascus cannonballus]RYP33416.1 hypothetical protein DL766_003479 [Monosporascus sp. MC13-8B]